MSIMEPGITEDGKAYFLKFRNMTAEDFYVFGLTHSIDLLTEL